MNILQLMLIYLKTSFFVIGGGQTFIPLLHDEFVRKGIMSLAEFNDLVTTAQIIPGPVMLHLTVLTSYKIKGIWGVIAALPCAFIVPITFISLFMYFRKRFGDSAKFDKYIFYSKALVIAILLNIAFNLGKVNVVKSPKAMIFGAAAFILMTFMNVGSVYVIFGSMVLIYFL